MTDREEKAAHMFVVSDGAGSRSVERLAEYRDALKAQTRTAKSFMNFPNLLD